MLANNLANASAPGFKADREFYSTYLNAEAAGGSNENASVMPVIERQWTDQSQGALMSTGNPLDVALKGKGFFVALSPTGPLLTRDGSFRLSPQGDLETQDGFAVRGQDGAAIRLDPTLQVEIGDSGEIRQDGQEAARIDVVNVKDAASLNKHGMNYFEFSSTAASEASDALLQPGSLESSNFQSAESAVRLVSVMRQFEMLQRAASIGSDMSRRALDEVAKPTS